MSTIDKMLETINDDVKKVIGANGLEDGDEIALVYDDAVAAVSLTGKDLSVKIIMDKADCTGIKLFGREE